MFYSLPQDTRHEALWSLGLQVTHHINTAQLISKPNKLPFVSYIMNKCNVKHALNN